MNGNDPEAVQTVAVLVSVSVDPGGTPAAVPTVNWDTEKVAAEEVKWHVTKKPPARQPVIVHPDGPFIEKPVIV